jgi:hypothetical protein
VDQLLNKVSGWVCAGFRYRMGPELRGEVTYPRHARALDDSSVTSAHYFLASAIRKANLLLDYDAQRFEMI